MNILLREVARKLRREGLIVTLRDGFDKLGRITSARDPEPFDCGIETSITVPVGAMALPSEVEDHINRYEAAPADIVSAILQRLPIDHSRFAFVDVGAGKGRVLLLASQFPFSRITGVEICEKLVVAARRNVALFNGPDKKCQDIEIRCLNVLSYELPQTPTVLFLYNPFDNVIMESFVHKVEGALDEFQREMFVIYLTPDHRGAWDKSKHFRELLSAKQCVVYEGLQIDYRKD